MADSVAFTGSVAEHYDSKLGPMFFEPYGRDIAARLPARASRVLEIAAGTGVASRHLLAALAPDATLTVTDLQEAMLQIARGKLDDPRVECRQADALALPFPDHSFHAAFCQFGLMFFADKAAGLREARRVLTPDGTLVLSTWGSLDDNPIARFAHEEVAEALPDPPPFLHVPFGLHDVDFVTTLLHGAGFSYVRSDTVEVVAESPSAHAAAMGLMCGSPMFAQLQERGADVRRLVELVAARLAREGGFAPMRLPMKAYVFTAQ
ncbi:class I SAM-dependent methyltransferase [Luteitalea sp. TBR-22]|uniref:class I SAM-dependent methyltransferase n=1 Tax=Luteitalea sp. TBR-22 TaxID=2802971 RepID=UPI001EF5B09D|nr:methyltransferase domain-containing protein [Luteitalea sp. TBR-22]